ncbi:MAG: helix-turn-helix domain-containing protein [Streptosporangiaceae bacterium]|nr:helix-turn-helix domain-containing protein [Streptosporangiaceae bacterium]
MQVSPAGQGDDKATFLAEFRALRARAGLEYDELAARAHFPTDVLKNAEVGPGLPGLPILTAYVRACGSDVVEWEERWRRLESPVSGASGLPTRPAGATPAAVAGARASVSVAAADAHDPERIRAALRADQEREEQAGRNSLTRAERRLSAGAADPLRTATGPATMIANGSHHKKPWPDAFDTPSAEAEPSGAVVPETSVAPPSAASVPAEPAEPAAFSAPSAPAEEEFDAFRATKRWPTTAGDTWQSSGTADSWQAFDTTPGSRANTSAGSVWSPSAGESSARETIEWRNAFAAEQASDTGIDFTRARTDLGHRDTSFGRSEPRLSRSESGLSRSEPGLSSAKADPGRAGSDAPRAKTKAAAPHAAQPARPNKQRANHPVLLTVLVVLVLIGCIAVLVFT